MGCMDTEVSKDELVTPFENELKKLFANDALFLNTTFIGRTCYGKLDADIRIRAEFVITDHEFEYDALQISLISRAGGVIDSNVIRLAEVIGIQEIEEYGMKRSVSPHLLMYHYEAQPRWFYYQPNDADLRKLTGVVNDYLEIFREPELTQGISLRLG